MSNTCGSHQNIPNLVYFGGCHECLITCMDTKILVYFGGCHECLITCMDTKILVYFGGCHECLITCMDTTTCFVEGLAEKRQIIVNLCVYTVYLINVIYLGLLRHAFGRKFFCVLLQRFNMTFQACAFTLILYLMACGTLNLICKTLTEPILAALFKINS